MSSRKILSLYGLKWNPFLPNIPAEALWRTPENEHFLYRFENLVMDGGFALITGDPGLGKSKCLHLLAQQLSKLEDVTVGVMERPQSSLNDFYREMGELFNVDLIPSNRYGGFKSLRERWHSHIKTTLFRPVLLIDEAQEMETVCMNELRMLGSSEFDSRNLLTTILCGDMRLPERFRSSDLLALGSRIQLRMVLEPYDKSKLYDYLKHALKHAGAEYLMTDGLMQTLTEHSAGNLRVLNSMAAELLAVAAKKELSQLDEKLFIEQYSQKRN
jgi:general secretion pathway protein A